MAPCLRYSHHYQCILYFFLGLKMCQTNTYMYFERTCSDKINIHERFDCNNTMANRQYFHNHCLSMMVPSRLFDAQLLMFKLIFPLSKCISVPFRFLCAFTKFLWNQLEPSVCRLANRHCVKITVISESYFNHTLMTLLRVQAHAHAQF